MPEEVKDKAAMADSSEPDGATPQETNDQPDDDDGDEPESETKLESALRKVREDLKAERARVKALEKEKADAAAKAKQLEDEQLAEQGKFRELAETRADEILDLKAKLVDIESLTTERDNYSEALTKLVTSQFAGIPDDVAELVRERDILGQIEWLEKYGEKYQQAGARGVPKTPKPVDQSEAARKQSEEAKKRDERRTLQQF